MFEFGQAMNRRRRRGYFILVSLLATFGAAAGAILVTR